MQRFRLAIVVAIGAIAGATLRWLCVDVLADGPGRAATIAVFALNVAGSALLGILIARQFSLPHTTYLSAGVGFAGGLTTFSTFAVDVAVAIDSGRFGSAVVNGIGTMAMAVLAAGIGFRLARPVMGQ